VALTAALMRAIYRGELRVGPAFGPGAARVARMRLPGAVGALVEKDLRVAWRDPALKALLVTGLVGPLLLLLLVLTRAPTGPGSGKLLLLLATFVGLGAFGSNAFGFERRGLLLLLAFPVDRFSILVGKNLASLTLRLPGAVLLLLAGLVIAPLSVLPAAATVAVATLLIAAAFDNYLSILFPATVPAAGANPYGGPAAGGRGLSSLALTLTLLPAVLIVSGPFAFLAWLPLWLEAPLLWWATLPLALAGAAAVYALLTAGAARLLERRETWLLERVLGEA
jgi:ABC-2 type transport system permease protein